MYDVSKIQNDDIMVRRLEILRQLRFTVDVEVNNKIEKG